MTVEGSREKQTKQRKDGEGDKGKGGKGKEGLVRAWSKKWSQGQQS